MRTVLKHTTEKGQLFSITDDTAQHTLGPVSAYTDKYGAVYEYWKNTTGSACVAGDGYFRGAGNIIQADANNPQAVAATPATAQAGQVGLAQAAIPDESFGWFLVYGPTTGSVGKLFFGNIVNHTQTRTTTIGEPLKLHDGIWADDTTWALGAASARRAHFAVALEVVTSATSCHVFMTGEHALSTT